MQINKHCRDGYNAGLRPPTNLKPWEWAAANVKISNSERSSKFDPEQTPWWKAPMECAGDFETREVVVIAPTGCGKSTMAEALIPYIVSEDPGSLLYASQTDSDAKFWAETRLKPAMKSCAQVAALWPEDRHASRKLEIIFPHMAITLGGANMSNFQEKSVRWLYGDEVWAWSAGLLREFLARHHNRWNRKVFLVSQGGVEGGELHLEWLKSDQSEFGWRCECGESQPFGWDGVRFDTITNVDGKMDEQASANTARILCRKCGKQYLDEVKTRRMLSASNMDNGNGGYIVTNHLPIDGIRGFHIDSLAVWWIPWKLEVLEFLEAQRMAKQGVTDKLRQWRQKRRAQFWSDAMGENQVVVKQSGYTKLEFENGERDDNEDERFATIDCGGDHYWLVICAWRKGGHCKILFEGYVLSDGGFENGVKRICDQYGVKPRLTFIDIGYDQDRILDLCVLHDWTGIKGDGSHRYYLHSSKGQKPVERMTSSTKRARAKSGGIARFFFVASNPVKDVLARMLQNDQIEIPADASSAMMKHMVSEVKVIEKNGKTGEEKSVWKKVQGRANHLWDCMYYQVGVALALDYFDV